MPPETDLIALALAEDIGEGDVTTQYFTDPNRRVAAKIVAREACVVAGLDVAEKSSGGLTPNSGSRNSWKMARNCGRKRRNGIARACGIFADRGTHRPKFPSASFRRCHTRWKIRCGGAWHFRQNP
jgi:hypothetical protein